MRVAYLDCFSGISGDMTLGALVDAGVQPEAISAAVAGLGVPAEISFETVRRRGFRATFARVMAPEEHVHRHLHHIEEIIDRSALSASQKELALRIFMRLAQAEARVHGIDIKKVHFHEVGAVDSIVDIVGTAVGFDLLGVDRVIASPVPTGRGTVLGAHGRMPIPAPATAELLCGIPLAESSIEMELTTPTGAAILATLVHSFGPLPSMRVQSVAAGAGSRDLDAQPNILRLFLGEMEADLASDRIWVLETNIDDLPAEVIGYTTARLLAAGALDAYVTPILMKKNRPAALVTVLCQDAAVSSLEELLFQETTTLGIRRHLVNRHTLDRKPAAVDTPYGPVRGKLAWSEGKPPLFSPEYDDCARIAAERSVPLREIYAAAQEAARREPKTANPPP